MAVAVGGGGLFVANAASSAPSSVVTIDPVRILDTRDPVNVGLPGPFMSAISQKLQVTGPIATTGGPQTVVPSGATGVLLNVTVVGPSAPGFISVRPGDAAGAPSTSSLNFAAGDIVPNAVQVGLPAGGTNDGEIDITYDAFGVPGPTTDVLIDVVGYLVAGGTGSTDPALLARLEALEVGQPFAVAGTASGNVSVTNTPSSVLDVSVTAPVDGQVTINYSAGVSHSLAQRDVRCFPAGPTETPSIITSNSPGFALWKRATETSAGSISGTRMFNISAGETTTYSLLCQEFDQDGGLVLGRAMTAIFTPAR